MNIHEAWCHQGAIGLNFLSGRTVHFTDLNDHAIGYRNIRGSRRAAGAIDYRPATNYQIKIAHVFSPSIEPMSRFFLPQN